MNRKVKKKSPFTEWSFWRADEIYRSDFICSVIYFISNFIWVHYWREWLDQKNDEKKIKAKF